MRAAFILLLIITSFFAPFSRPLSHAGNGDACSIDMPEDCGHSPSCPMKKRLLHHGHNGDGGSLGMEHAGDAVDTDKSCDESVHCHISGTSNETVTTSANLKCFVLGQSHLALLPSGSSELIPLKAYFHKDSFKDLPERPPNIF